PVLVDVADRELLQVAAVGVSAAGLASALLGVHLLGLRGHGAGLWQPVLSSPASAPAPRSARPRRHRPALAGGPGPRDGRPEAAHLARRPSRMSLLRGALRALPALLEPGLLPLPPLRLPRTPPRAVAVPARPRRPRRHAAAPGPGGGHRPPPARPARGGLRLG